MTPEGEPCAPGEKGIMVLKRPFPGLIADALGRARALRRDYWQRIPGVYYTGDSAHIDEDGYVWFAGRADEIIKIAGHRIGTIEVETAFLTHPAVAEAGVTGRPDELRGEVISAFVVLKQGITPSEALQASCSTPCGTSWARWRSSARSTSCSMLPKTRSGKIMRRVLKAVMLDRDPGDITTIEDEGSVEEARQAWRQMREEIQKGERAGARE